MGKIRVKPLSLAPGLGPSADGYHAGCDEATHLCFRDSCWEIIYIHETNT